MQDRLAQSQIHLQQLVQSAVDWTSFRSTLSLPFGGYIRPPNILYYTPIQRLPHSLLMSISTVGEELESPSALLSWESKSRSIPGDYPHVSDTPFQARFHVLRRRREHRIWTTSEAFLRSVIPWQDVGNHQPNSASKRLTRLLCIDGTDHGPCSCRRKEVVI